MGGERSILSPGSPVELRTDTARELRTFLTKKAPAAPAFTFPRPEQVVKMLRADLEARESPTATTRIGSLASTPCGTQREAFSSMPA